MQLFTSARSSDIENAPGLLRFAFAIDPVNPLFGLAAVCALALERRNQKFGNLSRFVGLGQSAL